MTEKLLRRPDMRLVPISKSLRDLADDAEGYIDGDSHRDSYFTLVLDECRFAAQEIDRLEHALDGAVTTANSAMNRAEDMGISLAEARRATDRLQILHDDDRKRIPALLSAEREMAKLADEAEARSAALETALRGMRTYAAEMADPAFLETSTNIPEHGRRLVATIDAALAAAPPAGPDLRDAVIEAARDLVADLKQRAEIEKGFFDMGEPVVACSDGVWQRINDALSRLSGVPPDEDMRDAVITAAAAYRAAEQDGTPRLWKGKDLCDLADALDAALSRLLEQPSGQSPQAAAGPPPASSEKQQ